MQSRWFLTLALAGVCAAAQGAAPAASTSPGTNATSAPVAPAAATGRPPATPPYFTGNAGDLFVVLPPAPQDGDARDVADRRIFRETRALEGSPRWQMATADAELGQAQMLKHFSCSLDIELTPQQAPRLVALAQKATREAAASMAKAKDFFKRKRPFKVDEGAICVAPSTVGESFDYPSGHTTAGWAWALVLSQVDPSRAAPLLVRGRAIGDSRVVCGVHNASAVEGARMLTSAAMSVISASGLYQSDLAVARTELAGLRAGPHAIPDAARCAIEAELVKPY